MASRREIISREEKPDQAGDAYIKLDTKVDLHTDKSDLPASPWALRVLRAYMDWLPRLIKLETCSRASRLPFIVTPKMVKVNTPLRLVVAGGTGVLREFLRVTVSS